MLAVQVLWPCVCSTKFLVLVAQNPLRDGVSFPHVVVRVHSWTSLFQVPSLVVLGTCRCFLGAILRAGGVVCGFQSSDLVFSRPILRRPTNEPREFLEKSQPALLVLSLLASLLIRMWPICYFHFYAPLTGSIY